MAPRRARKSEPAIHQSESEDENSQQSSQEADMHVLKAARNVVSTVWASQGPFYAGTNWFVDSIQMKNRRESKRKAIEADFKKRVADIGAKIDAHFEARKSRM